MLENFVESRKKELKVTVFLVASMVLVAVLAVTGGTDETNVLDIECDPSSNCGNYVDVAQKTDETTEIKAQLTRTINGIALDLDGNRVVEVDNDGIAEVSCTPMENDSWKIDAFCYVTLK